MNQFPKAKKGIAVFTLMAVLWACGGSGGTTEAGQGASESKMAADITGMLQACSYDGTPVALSPETIQMNTNADAAAVVAEIMKFTGLPQNFEVMEADVPNAAAVIVMGKDNLPHRVIAYNKKFMNEVRTATQNNNWAPISIMAHEIGHHLCGHTIMPGGSQPPTELEADKFSGFVLYKMGAVLADAQKAMNTLVPDTDSKTHPGRTKRVAAIQDGWKLACTQQSLECSGLVAANKAGTSPTATPTTAPDEPVAKNNDPVAPNPPNPGETAPATDPVATGAPTTTRPDVLPVPSETNIPSKFDRFVMDEMGIMNAAVKEKLGKQLLEYAKNNNVEIVAIVAKDLKGKTADEYAYDMLRQLRVGQLEVGNGACLVIAPNQKDLGVALGSGLRFEFNDDRVKLMKSALKYFMDNYLQYGARYDQSESIARACEYIVKDTKSWEWVVRYSNLEELLQLEAAERKQHSETGKYDPMQSKVWRKIVRVKGTLISKNGAKNNKHALKMQPMPVLGHDQTMEFKTDDGKFIALKVNKYTEATMPVKLEEGKTYSFVLRESSAYSLFFNLLSYDLLD